MSWAKRVSAKLGAAGLYWGLQEPLGDVEVRVERAFREWTQYWGAGPKLASVSGRTLPPITAQSVEEVVRRLRTGKALGPGLWSPEELRMLPKRAYAQLAGTMSCLLYTSPSPRD